MSEALQILALVVAVAVVAASARRLGLSAPLVLVVVGVIASLIPGMPDYHVDPEVVLIGFLPPLLYAAALRTSLVDVRANRQAIGIMAVGAVVFTTVIVGLVAWAVDPRRLARRGLRPGRSRVAAGRGGRDDDRAQGRHAAADRRDPRGREPAQRRDRTGGAAHDDRRHRHDRHGARGRRRLRRRRRRRSAGRAGHGRRACRGPQAGRGPGARHDAVAGRAVPHLPRGRGGRCERRAGRRHRRPAARAQVAGPAVGVVPARRADQLAHHHLRPGERGLPADRASGATGRARRDRRRLRHLPARPDLRGGPAGDAADADRLGVRRDGGLQVRYADDARARVELEPRDPGVLGRHARRGHPGRCLHPARTTHRTGTSWCSPRSPWWPAPC